MPAIFNPNDSPADYRRNRVLAARASGSRLEVAEDTILMRLGAEPAEVPESGKRRWQVTKVPDSGSRTA